MPRRGSTADRGYGRRHRELRKAWERVVNAGGVECPKCGRLIVPGEPWDLGHTEDRSGYTGPEHQRCNRATAARRPGSRFSRVW